jgi:hypothetical protein
MHGLELLGPQFHQGLSRSSFRLSLLALGGVFALNLLPAPSELRHQHRTPAAIQPAILLLEPSRSTPSVSPTGLVVSRQTGAMNDALPTGISLSNGTGGEIVTLLGLADGFELSLGAHGTGGWLLTARDLDQAFVGPTKDFVGSIEVMVQLYSASGRLLDSQPIHYEWLAKQEAKKEGDQQTSEVARLDAAPTAQSQPRTSAEIATLIERAEALLRNGDIASARLLLNRAAADGSTQAAFELGMTFDAQFLRRKGALGVDADETQARDWYERASKLGSAEASVQLKRLAEETTRDGAH